MLFAFCEYPTAGMYERKGLTQIVALGQSACVQTFRQGKTKEELFNQLRCHILGLLIVYCI